jgi:hypothetical protein|eukprot:COSAG01_NODE_1908_length_8929_cov_219.706195_2_plen_189_part_00
MAYAAPHTVCWPALARATSGWCPTRSGDRLGIDNQVTRCRIITLTRRLFNHSRAPVRDGRAAPGRTLARGPSQSHPFSAWAAGNISQGRAGQAEGSLVVSLRSFGIRRRLVIVAVALEHAPLPKKGHDGLVILWRHRAALSAFVESHASGGRAHVCRSYLAGSLAVRVHSFARRLAFKQHPYHRDVST